VADCGWPCDAELKSGRSRKVSCQIYQKWSKRKSAILELEFLTMLRVCHGQESAAKTCSASLSSPLSLVKFSWSPWFQGLQTTNQRATQRAFERVLPATSVKKLPQTRVRVRGIWRSGAVASTPRSDRPKRNRVWIGTLLLTSFPAPGAALCRGSHRL